jgi:predicted regulator of Ras-like GTPase activity (Roadblock/LC7/MglB family)
MLILITGGNMIESVELDDRIEKCERILAADENSQIFAALADSYRKKGDFQKAQDACLRGLKIHPNYASARVVMAKIFIANENFDSAWQELKKAIDSSGRTRTIDILESEVLIRKGKKNEAKTILERLYSSDPEDEVIKNLMTLLGEERSSRPFSSGVAMPDFRVGGGMKKELTLSEVTSILKVMPRVLGVAAVNHQGLALEGRFDGSYSREEVAALSKSIYDVASAGGAKVDLGKTREILIETQASKLWIFIKDAFLLVIFTRDDVSMGSLKLKLEELLRRMDHFGEVTEQERPG